MQPYIIGNWKMNTGVEDGVALAREVARLAPPADAARCVVCPPHTAIHPVAQALAGSGVAVGAQNLHHLESGAHTGEVSATMLAPIASFAIIGHSERRAQCGETDALVALKAAAAAAAGITPVICVGEEMEQRRGGGAEQTVAQQLRSSMDGFTEWPPLIVAYEPLWAIGSGRTPTPEEVGSMCAALRQTVAEMAPGPTPAEVPVLYGGSVSPDNAADLCAAPYMGGFLVGGSSLDAAKFAAIARAAAQCS